jgi:VCBS repeat-containing protein
MLATAPPLALDDTYAVPLDAPLVVGSPTTTVGERITQNIPPGTFGFGAALIPQQSLMMRFEVVGPVRTAQIGGHLGASQPGATVFGAIVALTGPDDFPDSVEMNTPDVLGHALISPTNPSSLSTAELSVELSQGWYALVFGGGRLGANGSGVAPSVVLANNYTYASSADGWSPLPNHAFQFFVDAEGIRGGVLDNDSDPEGFPLRASIETPPAHGALVLDADGTFTYTPAPGFTGLDSFRYTVSNGETHSTATAWLGRPHAPPVASSDRYEVLEGQSLAGGSVLANDLGENLEAVLLAGPETGTLAFNPDGTFVYSSTPGHLEADRFVYRVRQGTLWSAPATVTLEIVDANIAPDAQDDVYRIEPGETLMSGVGERLASAIYFTDEGLSSLNKAPLDGGTFERVRSLTFSASSIALDLTNRMVYWYVGAPEYRIYRAPLDGGAQELVVQMPEVEFETEFGTARDNPSVRDMAIDVAAGKLYWTTNSVQNVYPAKLSRSNVDGSNIEDLWTQSPFGFPQGIDLDLKEGKVYWTSSQEILRTDMESPRVTETVVNIAGSGGEISAIALDVSRGKLFWTEGQTFSGSRIRTANLDGSTAETIVTLDRNAGVADMAVDPARGKLYWSDYWFDTINRVGLDGANHEIVLRNGLTNPFGFTLDQTFPDNYIYGVLANDSDLDGDALVPGVTALPEHGTLVLNTDGSFKYIPDAGFVGRDKFTYILRDGQAESEPATVTIFVGNAAPVATADNYEIAEDAELSRSAAEGVLANDSDDGDSLRALLLNGPSHGQLDLSPDGAFVYRPSANFFGEDSFTYQASDGEKLSAPATVTIRITSVNDAPVAVADEGSVEQGKTLSFEATGLLENDFDADGDTLSVISVSPTANTHGTVTLSGGVVTYTPDAAFSGNASFTYRISDGQGGEAEGVMSVRVDPRPGEGNTEGKAQGFGSLDSGRRLFQFNVQAIEKRRGLDIQGHVNFIDVRNRIALFSTRITSFVIAPDGRLASFSGVGTVNGRSGYTFTVHVEDNAGANRGRDEFRIEIHGRGVNYDSLDYAINGGRIDRIGDIRVQPRRNTPSPIALARGLALVGLWINEGRHETLVEQLAKARLGR